MLEGRGRRVVMLTTDVRVDRRTILQARTLADHGLEVVVVAVAGEGAASSDRGVAIDRVTIDRAPTARIRRRATGALLALRGRDLSGYEHAFAARARRHRPDVVHVHNLPLLRAGTALGQEGVLVLYEMHELYSEQRNATPAVRERLREIERTHIGRTDARIAVNPLIANEVSRRYGGIDVGVLQNAVEAPAGLHDTRHDRIRAELGLPPGRRILLYQGWISEERNLVSLVEGLALVTDPVELVLMGYGEHLRTLLARAAELGIADRVHHLETKSPDEYLLYTASADVGVIPNSPTWDANTTFLSPYKLYEFVLARLPILANDLPFVRAVVEEHGFGVATRLETAAEWAAAIRAYPWERLEEIRAAMAREEHAFSWESERHILLAVYERLLEGRPSPA